MEEVETILANLKEREGAHIANYFAAAFFGDFRPSEQVALRWDDFDFKQRNVRVARAVVRGKTKASTKTCLVRDVELSERAWSAFEVQRAITQLVGRQVFWNPATKAPWADIWIDGADKSRERDKLSKAFAASTTASADSITEPSRGVGKSAES